MSSEEKYLVEFCANNNCPNHTNCDLCMYEKGRQDAIDECIKFIKEHSSRVFIDCDGWGCSDNDREDIFKLFWLEDLEQLKEKKGTEQ